MRSLAAICLFGVVFLAVHYLHVAFFPVNVIFYAAIFDAVLAAILSGLALFTAGYFRPLRGVEKAQLVLIWLLAGYGFAISIPTVIDRSLSFYIIEKIQQRGGGVRQEALEGIFKEEYTREYRLIDVRLTEQLQSGTIEIVEGCVKITDWGATVASFGQFYRKNLLPKKRLLMGEYTDDLTAPFAKQRETRDYSC